MESNKLVKSSEHLKSSELAKSCEFVRSSEGKPEPVELYAQISQDSKARTCPTSEFMKLLTHNDASRGHGPLEDACLERQRMREFN